MLQELESDALEASQKLHLLERQREAAKLLAEGGEVDTAYFMELKFQNIQTLLELRTQVINRQLELDLKAGLLTSQHPDYIASAEALASARSMLQQEVRSTLALIESSIRETTAFKAELDARLAEVREQVASVPENEITLSRLDHEITVQRDAIKDLTRNQVLSKINFATSPNVTVTLLSPAGSPVALKTKDYVRMGLAPLMSLVVGLLVAFFLDSLDHSFRSSNDVEEYLGLPVLAALPETRI
jgi:uncharacterized protein involved in exopolysaccharide biosynthesis